MNYLNLPELGIVLLQSGEAPSSADLKAATAWYGSCDSIRSRNEFISHFSIRKGRRQCRERRTNRHKYALRLWSAVVSVEQMNTYIVLRLREFRVEQPPASFICSAE